jgi:DNA primase
VVLVFDSDTAGMEAANRALEVCLSQKLDIKLGFVPEGKDPCDFLLTAGKDAFDRVIEQATDVLQFKWDRLTEAFGSDDSLASRRAVLNELLQAVATGLASNNLSAIDSGLIVNRLSKIIGLTAREINTDLTRRMGRVARAGQTGREESADKAVDWGQGLYAAAQREVLEVLINEPGLFRARQEEIPQSLFDVPVLRAAAEVLWDVLGSGEEFSLSSVLARTESVRVAECLVELQRVGEEKGNYHSRLSDALAVLLRGKTHAQISAVNRGKSDADSTETEDDSVPRQNPHSLGIL